MMSVKQLGLLLPLCCFYIPCWAQSLEQAVAQVLANNPKINASYNEFKVSSYDYEAARSGYYPSIDLNAGIGYEQTNTDTIDDKALTRKELGLSIRQLLFDGFATSSDVSRGKNEALSLQYQLYSDAENLALEVVKVYLLVRSSEQIVELSKRNREVHQKIYDDIDKRSQAGVGSSADLSQIAGRLSRADANLLSARNNLIDAKTQFLRVVNQLPKDLVDPIADANMLPKELTSALQLASDKHPLLQSAQFGIQAAHSEHESSQSAYYPSLHLELGANYNENIDGIEGPNEDVSAMLRLRYNLYQGGKDRSKELRGGYRISLAKENHRDVLRQIQEGTRLSWSAYEILSEQLTYLQQHVERSYETLISYKKQFSLGKRTLLDLLNTENELFEARKTYVAAQYDELLAQYRILNATGQLLDSMRVARPDEWQEL